MMGVPAQQSAATIAPSTPALSATCRLRGEPDAMGMPCNLRDWRRDVRHLMFSRHSYLNAGGPYGRALRMHRLRR